MNDPALIEFENITVMRGRTVAVDNVSLRIGVGEHLAILGPNGCGKSTLIKAITRECYPVYDERSSVRIFGQEQWNVAELRALLGIVSNDLMATCTRSVTGRDIVLSGYFSSVGIWPHQEARRRCWKGRSARWSSWKWRTWPDATPTRCRPVKRAAS